jgi:hypothetical protein
MKFTDRLNMIIGGESSAPKKAANAFTPALNNVMGGKKTLKKMIPKGPGMKPKSQMKQYGDKGYVPATGEKTGM